MLSYQISSHRLVKRATPFDDDDEGGDDDEDYWDSAFLLSASLLLFTTLLFLLLHFPEWPEGNQTTNKRVNKETAYIDPWAL